MEQADALGDLMSDDSSEVGTIEWYYGLGLERERLAAGLGAQEFARTRVLLERYLPASPAVIADIGGGPGRYDGFRGNWLAINASMLVPSAEVAAAAAGEESDEETGWAGIYAAHFLDDDAVAPY